MENTEGHFLYWFSTFSKLAKQQLLMNLLLSGTTLLYVVILLSMWNSRTNAPETHLHTEPYHPSSSVILGVGPRGPHSIRLSWSGTWLKQVFLMTLYSPAMGSHLEQLPVAYGVKSSGEKDISRVEPQNLDFSSTVGLILQLRRLHAPLDSAVL